ncbi:MAG: site-specific integrase, partial [Deltaproteobacteria bacterium]|nr:site-specific integrase [Deltaproteobacteria bacterium]
MKIPRNRAALLERRLHGRRPLGYARANNRPSEQTAKASILKHHLRPAFGPMRLSEITVRHVEGLKAKMLDAEKSRKTVNNTLAVLSKIIRYAREVGVVETVPAVKLLKLQPQRFDFLDFEEYERLLATAQAEPEWAAAALVGGDAGLRLGEIIALAWEDVDLKAGVLTVMHSEWHGQLGGPKGGRSRTVPLTDRLADALRAQRHLRGPRVFCGADGAAWTRNVMKAGLSRACRRAGLRIVGWHPLRHTFCSHLAMKGAPPKAIQELAGHTSLNVTLRYMHLAPGVLRDAIRLLCGNRMANLIAGGSRGLFVGLGAPDPPGAGSGLPEGRRGPAESSDLRVHPHLVET